MTTVKRGANTYRIKFNKQGSPSGYPHSYKMFKNGVEFTEGGGASSKQGALHEALADIEQHEHEIKENLR